MRESWRGNLLVSAPLFYLYTPCFCGARGPARFVRDRNSGVFTRRPDSRFRFAAEVAASGRTLPDRSGAPIGRCVARRVSPACRYGTCRNPCLVWLPGFSDVPVPCGRSDCVRSVFVCFCAADVSFWYESTRCGCLERGKSTFEYPATKYDFLTK